MEVRKLITEAARAIRMTKYTRNVRGRRTDDPTERDLAYAAAAIPAVLYALADVTATHGRLSSGALVQLAHKVEEADVP